MYDVPAGVEATGTYQAGDTPVAVVTPADNAAPTYDAGVAAPLTAGVAAVDAP
jgi:hypothetical protein